VIAFTHFLTRPLDTENHFDPLKSTGRKREIRFEELWKLFEANQSHLMERAHGPIDRSRAEIYAACLNAAEKSPGVFTLTVPTGAGKTRAVMGFALRHALHNDLKRIIVAIPYTSIIEQNAAIYKDILGPANVLEYHSQVALREDESSYHDFQWARLAAENWDAPIITTTTVQLFDSLFSKHPSACRKLHNLSNCVIVLDEVQTLPPQLLQPILFALSELVRHYRTTVVMSTATQPYFDRPEFSGIFDKMSPIIRDIDRYFTAMKRVAYHVRNDPQTLEKIANEIRAANQVMAVLNTKKDAIRLFQLVDQPDALHLSTLLCPYHRAEILQTVRERLARGENMKLITTQVVEAGVDLDFPVVMRAMGPLDRIVQAAGRCNREGKLACGEVHVFTLKDGTMPSGAYRTGADHAKILIGGGAPIETPDTHRTYFDLLFRDVNTDDRNIMGIQNEFKFAEIAERFHIIPDNTVPVLVPYPKYETSALLQRIEKCAGRRDSPREVLRACQPHLVSVFRPQHDRFIQQKLVRRLPLDLYLWLGKYDAKMGLVAEAVDPENLVF
jgi:CRISPR-associated endonuclease/helicase Cas3